MRRKFRRHRVGGRSRDGIDGAPHRGLASGSSIEWLGPVPRRRRRFEVVRMVRRERVAARGSRLHSVAVSLRSSLGSTGRPVSRAVSPPPVTRRVSTGSTWPPALRTSGSIERGGKHLRHFPTLQARVRPSRPERSRLGWAVLQLAAPEAIPKTGPWRGHSEVAAPATQVRAMHFADAPAARGEVGRRSSAFSVPRKSYDGVRRS